ncbi:MAG: BTAD domain-containing putative transcriptional regulator, partial [Acidimicrobiales bacterium]
MDLRFTVLRGTVGVSEAGHPVALGGAQQRRVLAAFLAESGVVVSADRLVEAVWPDGSAPEGARRTAMSYVSRLRSAIGADHLVTRDNGYVLELGEATYDAAEFEALLAEARRLVGEEAVPAYDAALALWSGRAFGDDGNEWWLQPVAARLEELRLLAEEDRAERLIDCGRHAEAVVDLDRLVTEQPLRERFVDLLMRALYLAGRQAEALRAFQRFRDYLAEETGLLPSDALVLLEQRITVGDPSLAPMETEAVPGYELAEVIGEGSFGSVYRAVQPSVGREVAVKVIRPELADDPRFVQRFEAEAQLVARIEHPHVVPLYDYWRRPGGAFLVFRLLRGGSLAEREAEGAVDLDAVSRLVDEVGGALAAAHALGVVHRDVKPANILFDEAGNSYLADFGIAERDDVDEDLDLRSAGSPLYASPEQIRDATASSASDQYALAVVVWEALCGRAPFGGSSVTEVGRVKFVDSVPPLDAGVDGAGAVGPVLAKATAPHPADRFGSVVEFVAAWRTAVAGPDLVRATGETGAPAVGRSVAETLASLGVAGVNPYKGLRSFQEADAGEFCGRAELVTHLVERVAAGPFVTVVGPSGSGKSSLVHAGVIPEFRRRGALVVSMVPGSHPLVELEAALRRVATVEDEATIGARLRTPGGLVAVARDLVAAGEQLVLVVDQFEELWTLVPDVAARDLFADLLAHAAGPQDVLRVVA